MTNNDPCNLDRFLAAQEGLYEAALADLRGGSKRSHWMWFIFPQIAGLGHSPTSQYYSIKSAEEARQYLKHPVLGARLLECAGALLDLSGRSASQIFGFPDDMKLKSSMTLFASVADSDALFARVLDKFFGGERDQRTLDLLRS